MTAVKQKEILIICLLKMEKNELKTGIDQEVEFHEIEVHFFMRSKLCLIMGSKLSKNILQF